MSTETSADTLVKSKRVTDAKHGYERAQQAINLYFWSTELSYEIVSQLVLKKVEAPHHESTVYSYIHDSLGVRANAFKLTAKQRQCVKRREALQKTGHYHRSIKKFELDLKKDLEHACLYVIRQSHTMLEVFLKRRLVRTGINEGELRKAWTPYPRLPDELIKRGVKLEGLAISHRILWKAEIYRTLRNIVTHEEIDLYADQPWSDEGLIEKLRKKHCPDGAITAVCRKAQRLTDRSDGLPLLFFYALCCLTDYRNMVNAIDDARPVRGGVVETRRRDAYAEWYAALPANRRKGLPGQGAKVAWNGALEAVTAHLLSAPESTPDAIRRALWAK